jgi:hypothetical protein
MVESRSCIWCVIRADFAVVRKSIEHSVRKIDQLARLLVQLIVSRTKGQTEGNIGWEN